MLVRDLIYIFLLVAFAGIGISTAWSGEPTVFSVTAICVLGFALVFWPKPDVRSVLLGMIPKEQREEARYLEEVLETIGKKDLAMEPGGKDNPLLLDIAVQGRAHAEVAAVTFPDEATPSFDVLALESAQRFMKHSSAAYGFGLCRSLGLVNDITMPDLAVARQRIEGAPPLTREDLMQKTAKELRQELRQRDSNATGLIEKEELIDRLLSLPSTAAPIVNGDDEQKNQDTANKMCIVQHTDVESEADIVYYNNSVSAENAAPRFYIALDHKNKFIVMAICGTGTMAETLTHLGGDATSFLEGKAHTQLAKTSRIILDIARPILVKLVNKHADYKLVVTGHSLGGSAAMLIMMLIVDEGMASLHGEGVLVECYAFGPPPFLATYDEDRLTAFREPAGIAYSSPMKVFVYQNDIVPRLCQHSIHATLLHSKAVRALKWSANDRMKFAFSQKLDEAKAKEIETQYVEELDTSDLVDPLFLPGQIYWMWSGGKHPVTVPCKEFGKLIIKHDVLPCHLPTAYEGIVDGTAKLLLEKLGAE